MNYYCIDNSIDEMMSRGSDRVFRPGEESLKYAWESYSVRNGKHTMAVIAEWRKPHIHEANDLAANVSFMNDEFLENRFQFVRKQTSGSRVDIDRYLGGDERCWFSMKRKPKVARAVRVYAPIGGIGFVSASEMLVCGAIAASVVERLESCGIAVELWASCCYNAGYDCIVNLVKIKSSEEYSDLGMIAYICGNEDVYRNIMWKERIAFASDLKRSGVAVISSYYDPCCYSSRSFDKSLMMPEEGYENTVIIPRIYDMHEAKMWLENFAQNNNANSGLE